MYTWRKECKGRGCDEAICIICYPDQLCPDCLKDSKRNKTFFGNRRKRKAVMKKGVDI